MQVYTWNIRGLKRETGEWTTQVMYKIQNRVAQQNKGKGAQLPNN